MPSSSNFEAGPWTPRRGDGLEVLDLGNCSLSFDAISPIFEVSKSSAKTQWSHLRSLSLHSNPLATTHPDYVERLQASPALPNLQIIDAKRVRERKRKGEVQESKIDRRRREKREERMKPSGTNVARGGLMRAWGQEQEVDKAEAPTAAIEEKVEAEKGGERKRKRNPVIDGGMEGRSKVSANQASQKSRPYLTSQIPSTSNEDRRGGPSRQKPDPPPAQPPAIINPDTGYLKSIPEITAKTVAEPPVIPKPSKTQTSVVQVIEISKRASEKGKKRKKGKVEDSARSGGVDPRELFAKPPVIEGENTGLGVGGW